MLSEARHGQPHLPAATSGTDDSTSQLWNRHVELLDQILAQCRHVEPRDYQRRIVAKTANIQAD